MVRVQWPQGPGASSEDQVKVNAMNPDDISPFDPLAGASAAAVGAAVPEPGAVDQAPAFNPDDFERMVLGSSTTGGTTEGAGREMLTGALESVAETGAPLAGGLMGLKIGTAVGGPVVGAPIGLGTGLLAGWLMGEQAKKTLPPTPPEGSPLRVGTKFFADSLMTAPLAFGLPQAGQTAGRVGTFISKIGESARKSPGAYMTAEGIMSLGAGIGAGVGEGLNPGDPLAQAGGALIGGLSFQLPATILQNAVTNFGRTLANATPSILQAVNPVSWATDFTAQRNAVAGAVTGAIASRQMNRAVNKLITILEDAGEDVPQLIRSLEEPNLPGVPNMTAAQKTGNRTLAGLEARLAIGSDRYKPETMAQAKEAFTALRVLVDRLEATGDPAALQAAAQARDEKFNQILQNRLFAAEARAADRISRIPAANVADRREIGDVVRSEVGLALDNARMVEREFWKEGFAQLLRDNPTPSVDDLIAAEFKKKKMTPDEYKRIESVVNRYVDLRSDALKTVDDWKEEGLSAQNAASRFKANSRYRDFFEVEDRISDLKAGIGIVSPLDIKPSMAAANFLEAIKTKSDANFDQLPAELRNIMQSMGITKSSFLHYKKGVYSPEGIESGVVPYGYLPRPRVVKAPELFDNRSELLGLARQARATGAVNDARIYEAVADGILSDLSVIDSPLLNEARSFSKALNDTFTRTYANDILSVNPRGAEKLSPEQIVARLRQDTQRMDDVTDAIRFPRRMYEDALERLGPNDGITKGLEHLVSLSDDSLETMANAQRSILLGAAAKTLRQVNDPVTGTVRSEVNPAAMTQFVNENRELLDRLGLTATLQDATKAQNALELVRMQNSAINKDLRSQLAFTKVLAPGEKAVDIVANALNSKHPMREIGHLVKYAKAEGPEAVAGLKSIINEYLYQKAGGEKNFSPLLYQKLLFSPPEGIRGPAIVNVMRSHDILSLTELKNLKRILDPMIRIEKGLEANVPIKNFMTGASAAEDLALRFLGTRIGKAIDPNSLLMSSAGSKYVRQTFDQMPMLEMRLVLERATQNPQMMADMLKRGRTQRESLELAKKMRSYLLTSGLTAAAPEPPEEEMFPATPGIAPRSEGPLFMGRAAQALRQLPPAPNTRGVPGMGQQGQAGAQDGGGAPAGAPSQSRAMLQSLFPFDTISAMAAQPPQAPPPG